IQELGYQPNAMARSLAARRSNVLALVFPGIQMGLMGTLGEFVRAATERARERGYQLVLWPSGPDDGARVRSMVQQGMADGVLVMEVLLDDERVEQLEAAEIPYTMMGRTRDVTHRPSVDVDFEETVAEAVARLVELGHRHIAFLNHSQASLDAGYGPAVRAAEAYERATAHRGLPTLMRTCDDSPAEGRRITAELLAAQPDVTALVTMNELATFGVYAELQQRGFTIPDDISVLGIVSSPNVGTLSHPQLTTMHAPGTDLGRLAVDRLLSDLTGDAAEVPNLLIPCVYEPGLSVGPARTATDDPRRP
ncbi:MAG: substrate-binding domain-containing protein, partial [Demequina sp.]|uniref:substrate-binding domain-containing protein n=1 Tax=Demequina sp. TaxID=2050685 RepID=UPI003A86C6BF